MRMKRMVAGAVAIMMVVVALPLGAADALSCHCITATWGELVQNHWFNSNGSLAYQCGYSEGNNDYPCHADPIPNSCSGSGHAGCGGALLDGATSVDQLAALPEYFYNAERQSLQRIGCDGRVIANVPVTAAERDLVLQIVLAHLYV